MLIVDTHQYLPFATRYFKYDLAMVPGLSVVIYMSNVICWMENGFILKIHRSVTSAANKNDDVGEPKRPL